MTKVEVVFRKMNVNYYSNGVRDATPERYEGVTLYNNRWRVEDGRLFIPVLSRRCKLVYQAP